MRLFRRTRIPVLFLDVDGVLLPLSHQEGDWETVLIGGYHGTQLFSPSIVARLVGLHRTGRVQIEWLTSWDDEANTVLAPLVGFDQYKVHAEPTSGGDPMYWKERVVRIHANRLGITGRFVWIDDDMILYGSDVRVRIDYVNGFVVAPDSQKGLTHEHLDSVEEYLVV